jgi:phosphoglycolate phosphatase-like HAD superfamily hydrolase
MANAIQRNAFSVNTLRRKVEKFTHIVFDHDGTLVDTTKYPTRSFNGMSHLLKDLVRQGVKLYVWTARGRGSTIEILKSLAMIEHFDLLSCGGEDNPKPSPAGIESILPDVNPSKVVVIGDSTGDMVGGSAFGAFCIGALWSHGDKRASKIMSDNGADKSFISVDELREFLIKNT